MSGGYRLVDGIAYCETHDHVWIEGEPWCQDTISRFPPDNKCVERPLYWLHREYPVQIIHLEVARRHDRYAGRNVSTACGRWVNSDRNSTTYKHADVTCQMCQNTKKFRGRS